MANIKSTKLFAIKAIYTDKRREDCAAFKYEKSARKFAHEMKRDKNVDRVEIFVRNYADKERAGQYSEYFIDIVQ